MSSAAANELSIRAIQEELAQSIRLQDLTGAQRKEIEDAIFPRLNGYRNRKGANNVNYSAWEVGDEVHHIDSAGKTLVIGMVKAIPFTPPADISNRTKFDLYTNDKPAI